jgi:S1-C subfamily serine protease
LALESHRGKDKGCDRNPILAKGVRLQRMRSGSLIARGSLVLVLAAAWALPSHAQSAEHTAKCSEFAEAENSAMHARNWEQIVATARKDMTLCRDIMDAEQQAITLNMIAAGLYHLGHFEDVIPIAQRCVSLKPDAANCFYNLGLAYEQLGRIDEAIAAHTKAIAVGSYDAASAATAAAAKEELENIESFKAEVRAYDEITRPAPVITGSGFLVSESGFILTNDHVAGHCTEAHMGDGQVLTLIAASSDFDLALLKISWSQNSSRRSPKAVATFRPGAEASLGESVVTFGYPLEGVLSSHGNVSTGIVAAESGIGDDKTFIQISAPIQPGNSGGPVLDTHGNIVGVVVSKLDAMAVAEATGSLSENVNFAVRESVVKKFLADSGVSIQIGSAKRAMKTADVAAQAEASSIPITCVKKKESRPAVGVSAMALVQQLGGHCAPQGSHLWDDTQFRETLKALNGGVAPSPRVQVTTGHEARTYSLYALGVDVDLLDACYIVTFGPSFQGLLPLDLKWGESVEEARQRLGPPEPAGSDKLGSAHVSEDNYHLGRYVYGLQYTTGKLTEVRVDVGGMCDGCKAP